MTDQRPQYRALQTDVTVAEAQAEVLTVGQINAAARSSPSAALRLLERRHPERWGRARAEVVAAPPDELPVTPEVRFVDLGLISLTPEWTYVLMKVLNAAGMEGTPAEFFGNPDPLAGLREEDEPRPPWWDSSACQVPENRPRAMLVKPPLALDPGPVVAGPRSAAVAAQVVPGPDDHELGDTGPLAIGEAGGPLIGQDLDLEARGHRDLPAGPGFPAALERCEEPNPGPSIPPARSGSSPQADPSGQHTDRAADEPAGGAQSLAPDDPVERDREAGSTESHEGPSGSEGRAAATPASAHRAAGSPNVVPRFLPEWQGRLKPV